MVVLFEVGSIVFYQEVCGLKILTVVCDLGKGGTQRAAQVFAEAYNELGHDSKILSLYGLGVRFDEVKNKLYVWDTITEKNLQELIDWLPDVIHIHSHGPQKMDVDTLISALPSSKVIETNVFSKPSPWASSVDISFQLSNWAQWLFNLRGGRGFNSKIIPYPVKCDAFGKSESNDILEFKARLNIPQEAFIIGRVGQSFPGKWSPMLINVFNNLAKEHEDIYLLIINPPESILKEAGLSPYRNRVVHIPVLTGDKELSMAYSAMDVMALIVEQGESFGMVAPESILCETPVVALSTPWADNSQMEVVSNNIGGYVAHSKLGMLDAINLIYSNSSSLDMSVTARRYIINKYDYLAVAKNALETLSVNTFKDEDARSLASILEDSIDRPKTLTRMFLTLNNNIFRKLTLYTSGYKGWLGIPERICSLFLKKLGRKK